MNLKTKLILLCACISFPSIQITAQEDSIQIEESTEIITKSDFKKRKNYKYLDRNFEVDKTLFSLTTSPLFLFSVTDPKEISSAMKIGFEHKIKPSFSLAVNLRIGDVATHGYSTKYSASLGGKYYYTINSKIKAGKGANNFHANYFSFFIDELIKWQKANYYPVSTPSNYKEEWLLKPAVRLGWGIQRRFGKRGLFDIEPYILLGNKRFETGLNLQIGLAW